MSPFDGSHRRILIGFTVLAILGAGCSQPAPPPPQNLPGTWSAVPGIGAVNLRSLLYLADQDRLWVSGQPAPGSSGLHGFALASGVWTSNPSGVPVTRRIIQVAAVGDQLWALLNITQTEPAAILVSQDQGETWSDQVVSLGFEDPGCMEVIDQGRVILVGAISQGIFRSTDQGATWSESNQGLGNGFVQRLRSDPFDPEHVMAATMAGLFSSQDAGVTWEQRPLGLPVVGELVVELQGNPNRQGEWYLVARNEMGTAHILRSQDAGQTWVQVQSGLPDDVQPRSLVNDPEQADRLYIGTVFDGVYRSDDAGATWRPMNRNLPITERYIIFHNLITVPGQPGALMAATDDLTPLWRFTP